MTEQTIRRNPLENQIVEEVANNVASEMITEIQDEASQWAQAPQKPHKKVPPTQLTHLFLSRFAAQLAHRQDLVAAQLSARRLQLASEIPAGLVRFEILNKEAQTIAELETSFCVHLRQCEVLKVRIENEKTRWEARESRERGLRGEVERDLRRQLREDEEMWNGMGQVSWVEFEREWEARFPETEGVGEGA
jgi:hypothetical protein